MLHRIRMSLWLIASVAIGVVVTGCNNTDESVIEEQDKIQTKTRSVGTKTPKLTVYIETNDINPLNAGEYYFCDTTMQEEVIDYVILFASNIRGNYTDAWLHHNPNQTFILNHVDSLVRPLQDKGIKVLLGLLGDHTGVSFSNLTPNMINSFAQQVADCVYTYGLDGVDFGNEYGNYAYAPSGLPTPSATIFGNLIQKVRELLPSDKLVTAFRFGYVAGLNPAIFDSLDYLWPYFGCNNILPTGLPNEKWTKLSIRIQNSSNSTTIPALLSIQACARFPSDYGAIMLFNLREWSAATIINNFAPYVWGGRTVCHSGISYTKDY